MTLASKILLGFIIGIPTWFMSCFKSNKVISSKSMVNIEQVQPPTSFFDLRATSIGGEEILMSRYKGKRIIVLNVASKCGYTPQYAEWQSFFEKNADDFVVLGFPCNQFLGQEPASNAQILEFCTNTYDVTFPMFEKVLVKGNGQHEIYQWLTNPELNGWNQEVPSWNFCKYLIDGNGRLTHFFASSITPNSTEFIEATQ